MRYSPGMGVGSFFRMDLDPAWEGTARRYYPYSNPSVLQNKKLSSQIEDESLSSAVPPQFTRSPVHSLQPDNGLCRTVLLVFHLIISARCAVLLPLIPDSRILASKKLSSVNKAGDFGLRFRRGSQLFPFSVRSVQPYCSCAFDYN